MAEESKNKTSKGWIPKVNNYIKSKPQEECKEFWGRIGIVCGLIALTNSFNVSYSLVWINLTIAIVLFILGFSIATTLKNGKFFWLGIAITAGFAFLPAAPA